MINTYFYSNNNLVHQYLDGKVAHYPIKDRSVVLSTYKYVLKEGENFYTIAAEIFGNDAQEDWTYLADCNPIRHPDDWQAGDVVNLPLEIINDSDTLEVFNRIKVVD